MTASNRVDTIPLPKANPPSLFREIQSHWVQHAYIAKYSPSQTHVQWGAPEFQPMEVSQSSLGKLCVPPTHNTPLSPASSFLFQLREQLPDLAGQWPSCEYEAGSQWVRGKDGGEKVPKATSHQGYRGNSPESPLPGFLVHSSLCVFYYLQSNAHLIHQEPMMRLKRMKMIQGKGKNKDKRERTRGINLTEITQWT